MKYALFLGCTVQSEQFGYEMSVREVLPKLGVEIEDMKGASCCGFPAFSSLSPIAWHYLSARNVAIAESLGLDLLPLCNGCNLSFVESIHSLEENPELKSNIQGYLRREGLEYSGNVKVTQIIEVLHDVIGLDKIRASVKKPIGALKFAAHPGCHAIRPSSLSRPDDSENPQKLDDLIKTLGTETMDYPEKTDCCGSSLAIASGKTTLMIAGEKLRSVKKLGFDGLVTVCPFCFKIYDNRQRAVLAALGERSMAVPVFYYTQLLGLAMGIRPERLGLDLNLSPVNAVVEKVMGDGVDG